jgi:hypothetical protein
MAFEIKISDPDKTGAATLTFKITSIKTKQGTQTIVDSSADPKNLPPYVLGILNKPFDVKIAPDGTILYSAIPPMTSLDQGIFPMNTLEQLIKQNLIFLPDKPTAVGDKWTYPIELKFPWAKNSDIKIDYALELLGYETVKQLNCASIGISTTTDFKKQIDKFSFPDPSTGRNIDMKLDKFEQTLNGKLSFSPQRGILVGSSMETKAQISGSMDVPDKRQTKQVGLKINFNIKADLELQ